MRAIVIALILGTAGAAAADNNVDWSQYIEKGTPTYSQKNAPPRTVIQTEPTAPAKADKGSGSKAAPKQVATKPKTKARAKATKRAHK